MDIIKFVLELKIIKTTQRASEKGEKAREKERAEKRSEEKHQHRVHSVKDDEVTVRKVKIHGEKLHRAASIFHKFTHRHRQKYRHSHIT